MKAKVTDDPVFKLWWLFNQTRHILNKAREKELSPIGISPTQAAVLFLINSINYKVTPAEISKLILRESNTISVNLNVMAKRGLIKKTKDLKKKNQVRISITKKGREIYKKSLKRDFINYAFSDLSQEDQLKLRQYLEMLRNRSLDWLAKEKRTFSPFLM